ncbi:hypothetical protein ATSB10_14430 [Dyella thiooxydans]|uniref:Uncharacterized protein n=1 Tax=Dyella thiooxydans TaxID=445710 RepID=A0A160N0M2_9GAMM|nr:hypothetical protein ATSB10_14430 [Dyella thiooxydans]
MCRSFAGNARCSFRCAHDPVQPLGPRIRRAGRRMIQINPSSNEFEGAARRNW